MFFISMVELAFVFWLPTAFAHFKRSGASPLLVAIAVYVGALCMATLLSVDRATSFWSDFERSMGFWTYAHVVLFFLMVASTFKREREWKILFTLMTVSAISVVFVPVFSGELAQSARIISTLKNAAFLATYLVLAFFIALTLLLSEPRWNWRASILAVGCFLFIVCIFLTGTRGALVGMAAGLLFLPIAFLLLAKKDSTILSFSYRTIYRVSIGILISIGLVAVVGMTLQESLQASSSDRIRRIASFSLADPSLASRLAVWNVAWEGWRDHLLFGWGPENFDLLFHANYSSDLYRYEPWFDRAHNFILDSGTTTGVVGVGAYFVIFIAAGYMLYSLFKNGRASVGVVVVVGGTLVAHLTQTLFVFDSITTLTSLFIVLGYVHFLWIRGRTLHILPRTSSYALFVFGAFVMSTLWYQGVWRPYQENRLAYLGYQAFADGRDRDGEALTERALAYQTHGDRDVRRGVAEYVFEFIKQGGKRSPDDAKELFSYAIEKMEENITARPQDAKWYMYQGQLYNLSASLLGQTATAADAERRFLDAAKLSPNRPQIYLEIAQARTLQGDIAGVWEMIDTAALLAPDYSIIYTNGLVHAIAAKNLAREHQYMSKLEALGGFDKVAIRDAYYRASRVAEALLWQRKYIAQLEEDKDISSTMLAVEYKNLAVFYRDAGDRVNARDAALHVIELDSRQRTAAEAFLRELGF